MLSVFTRLRTVIEDLPLRPTIGAALVLGLALPVVAALTRDLSERREALLRQLAADHQRLAEVLAIGLETPIWEVRSDIGRPLIDTAMRDERVVEVTVSAPLLPRFLFAAAADQPQRGLIAIERPIVRGGEAIGQVRVVMSTASVDRAVLRQSRQALITGLVQLGVGLLLLFPLLRLKVLRPLQQLVEDSQHLAQGDVQARRIWTRRDELGVLGRSFEQTRGSLRSLIEDLETSNAHLRDREGELSRQAEVLRAILDNMTDGITLIDRDLRLRAWNDRFRQVLDLPADVVVEGMPITQLHAYDMARGNFEPEEGGRFLEQMQASFVPGRSWHTQLQRRDGKAISIRRQPLAEGGFVTTYSDVTEQVAAQRSAQQALHLLEAVMDAVPAVLHVKDRDLRYRLVNRYFLELWELRREAVIGRTVDDVFDADFLAEFVDRGPAVLADGRPLPFYEWSARLPDGDHIDLLGTKVPLCDAAGSVTHVVTVEIDISQRKRAERALRESEELHRLVVDLSPFGIMLHDRARIRFVNPAGCQILGVPDQMPLLGMHFIDFVADDDKAVAFERFRRLFDEARPLELCERRLVSIDDAPIEAAVAAVPVDQGGETQALVVFQDIGERKRSERSLKESERFYRNVVDVSPYGILLHDYRGIVLLNPAGRRILGVRDEAEIIGRHFRDMVHPDEREPALERLARVLKGETTGAAERRLVGLDGRQIDVTIAGVPLDRGGERLAFVMFSDITERKRAEADRQRWLQLFRDAIASIPNGFAVFDPNRRLVVCNEAFAELYAASPDSLAGRAAIEFMQQFATLAIRVGDRPVEDVSRNLEALLDRLWTEGRGPTQVELRDHRWMLLAHHRTAEGGLVIVRTDITDLKRMQAALADSEELYRLLVDLSPCGILLHDRDAVVFMNPAGCRMLGAPDAAAVVGRPYSEFIVAEERPDAHARIVRVLEHGEVLEETERRMISVDGREITVVSSAVPFSRSGERLAYVFFIDISERKRAEIEIARQRDALHQSEKMSALGSLLAGVAHELNNPLSVVVGRSIMLEDRGLDPSIAGSVAKIRAAAERCSRIVKTFLAMARQQAPDRRPVPLGTLIDMALDLLSYGLTSAGVSVEREDGADVPPVTVDADQLTQVLNNLIINAKQAMTDAPPPRVLRISTDFDPRDGLVRLTIADTGPGVPPEIRPRIFDPFFTTKPAGLGTGIGLAVCRGIVEAHGGSIVLDGAGDTASKVDAGQRPQTPTGASFTVTLPALRMDGSAHTDALASTEAAGVPDFGRNSRRLR